MKNGKLPGYNRIGKRESPGTFPGVPLKRLRKLGVKRWRTKALDRVEWASIIKEAKAKLKGP
jgi:hypothetical protein